MRYYRVRVEADPLLAAEIKYLGIDHNYVHEVDNVEKLTGLKTVRYENTKLYRVPFPGFWIQRLPAIETVIFKNNSLSKIEPSFLEAPTLKALIATNS